MSVNRRVFIRQLSIGSVVLPFWVEDLWAKECNKPDPTQDCTLPAPGTATQFIPNEAKVLTRYSAREISASSMAAQLQALRDATCVVRDLAPSNLVSWTKFVAQHCTNCSNSNPKNVHYDWQFLPWHRALLYFMERTMRILGKNDSVRLVYWDWENAASNVLPSIYAPTDQPLYWGSRGNLSGSQWPLTPNKVNVQGLLTTPNFSDFGGTSQQSNPTPGAYLGPHANVHNNFAPNGDMRNLYFSPRDPVFYAHHSNIDRLWASWAALSGHMNPDFKDAKAYFYDENQKLRYVLFNDLVDTKKLGYTYSTLMKPKVNVATLKSFALTAANNRVKVPGQALKSLTGPGAAFLNITNIKNLDKFAPTELTFGIFAGNPAVGTTSKDPKFLGLTSRALTPGHDHATENNLSAQIEVTGKLGKLMTKEGAFDLFIAPLDLEEKTTAPAIPLVADRIKLLE